MFKLITTACFLAFVCFDNVTDKTLPSQGVPYIMVLGIAQDAGYPQAACNKDCCKRVWGKPERRRFVSCLALIDPQSKERWIFDATPDFIEQLHALEEETNISKTPPFDGIFLTHAHIGHYTGLMHLGREAMGTRNVKVYAMPRMYEFISKNGPWDQLVMLNNIELRSLSDNKAVQLNARISVTPFLVPHRDEYSETVGYKIQGFDRSVIYIPDIDKWEKWETSIIEVIGDNDALFLDGSFFEDGELPGRDMSKIPHPFVVESMKSFEHLSREDKSKVHFIHFNHTNPLLNKGSSAYRLVLDKGFKIARQMQVVRL